jgi:threonine/homoserine/homoserine lactone efflux protein
VSLQILPLAITMVAGPQILTAIIFVTHRDTVRTSLSFLTGIVLAMLLGTTIAYYLAGALGDLGSASDHSSRGKIIQYVLAGLLLALAIRTYLNRRTARPPKWMAGLVEATPRKAFGVGFLLFAVMPTDIVTMLTVGTNIKQNGHTLSAALPFWALTLLIAASPLVSYLLVGRRAREAMPKVRDWMTEYSWLVNIFVLGLFVILILS